jgi:hypothetical protein
MTDVCEGYCISCEERVTMGFGAYEICQRKKMERRKTGDEPIYGGERDIVSVQIVASHAISTFHLISHSAFSQGLSFLFRNFLRFLLSMALIRYRHVPHKVIANNNVVFSSLPPTTVNSRTHDHRILICPQGDISLSRITKSNLLVMLTAKSKTEIMLQSNEITPTYSSVFVTSDLNPASSYLGNSAVSV